MLALGIRYLNGFVAASEPGHDRPEWPPHPARVFMAMAAAHFNAGANPAERDALLWLEALEERPAIHASEVAARALVSQFVPVNDKAIWKKEKKGQKPPPGLQSTPGIMRTRNARTFARAWLEDDRVYLMWPDADVPDGIRRSLESLCAKVHRIGHSSSLVQMWLAAAEEVAAPNWLPDDDRATLRLRVPAPGTLEDLERRYNREAVEAFAAAQVGVKVSTGTARSAARKRLHEEFPDGRPPARLRPVLSSYLGYARPQSRVTEPAARGTVFHPQLIPFTLERDDGPYRYLDLACVLAVTQRWREALVSESNDLSDRVRGLLSGHDYCGAPLGTPHVAFLPLGFVAHPHADARLLGAALGLPSGIARDERREVLKAAGRVRRLLLGRLGAWRLAPLIAISPPWNLRPETWTAHPHGSTHWSTITPVAFDQHPKTRDRCAYQREVERMVAQACVHIGLPEPRQVVATPVSAHLGTPPAHAFPRLRRKDGSERRHVHAIVIFDLPVQGPMLLGAGRYRGYGFCRPMREQEGTD
ncbi:MAG: type I-U CRISPR-associated protein Csb2 [Gaiellaceae bacterium]